jgi:g-D-glutamyl-meso-diaminopimelate peptidase
MQQGATGTDVMEIQAMLQKIGFYPDAIDGVFGAQMREAVMRFQSSNRLPADGMISRETLSRMAPYLLGYDIHTVRSGDSFYNISPRFYTDPALLQAANPSVNPNGLRVGQQLVAPYGFNVVDTNINYTYEVLERDIVGLRARYPFLEAGIAGRSVLGRNLYYLRLGNGPNQVFYNGVHHALEWITVPLLMKFTEQFLKAYVLGQSLGPGYNPRELWQTSSIYVLPMVNPDGVELVLNGLQPDNPYYEDLIRWNGGSTDFSAVWQANNRGVDLNHNYDAAWQLSKEAERTYGITGPGPTRYSGTAPESEPESRAVVNFTRWQNFRLVLAFHSQGLVIYWNYRDMAPPEARTIGERLSAASGYLLDEATGIASYAGYKDWFIQAYGRPGYTIEVGLGTNPLPITQFDQIYRDNLELMLLASIV